VFNDIHVVFGDKGTGKSCILREIANKYADNGVDARVYQPTIGGLEEIFDTKGKDLTIDLDTQGIKLCSAEIESVRNAREIDITSPTRYMAHFKAKSTNKNAKQILLKDIEPEEQGMIKREFLGFHEAVDVTAAYVDFVTRNAAIKKELNETERAEIIRVLSDLLVRLRNREWGSFCGWKEICLLNSAIEGLRKEVGRKTGTPARPITTGFRDYAMNRVSIEVNARQIIESVNTAIESRIEVVGSLGPNKGILHCQTDFRFQDGTITDGAFLSLTRVKKGPLKEFINCVKQVAENAYSEDLFQHVSDVNDIEDVEHIKSMRELLLFKRYFALGGRPYSPSSGEASMVMLQKELEEDKDVYILDEPEKSLANEYINDVIVPLIKARAKEGKKVFISTHNANIAVRTLPYSSIYRCHGKEGYSTYIGNPFSNNLVNPDAVNDRRDWKKVSMKTLEGGEEAFGERGIIYGHD
jgi:predicted ATPase